MILLLMRGECDVCGMELDIRVEIERLAGKRDSWTEEPIAVCEKCLSAALDVIYEWRDNRD